MYASTKALNVKVYSFEPFPSNADYFEKNMKKSNAGNIVFFRGAVAGRTEKRKLNVSDSWIKHELNENNDVGGYNVVVESISLDDIFSRIDICDLLKIDCEGSEYEIFYSAKPDTLKKINRIVGEFHNREGKENTGKALSSFLEKTGSV
ncbi:MAG: FkbM family methyltransferase [Chitinophagaceae bacterium]|nr:FkbM family methyltransferase [Chitinophagaceae bacterium]